MSDFCGFMKLEVFLTYARSIYKASDPQSLLAEPTFYSLSSLKLALISSYFLPIFLGNL